MAKTLHGCHWRMGGGGGKGDTPPPPPWHIGDRSYRQGRSYGGGGLEARFPQFSVPPHTKSSIYIFKFANIARVLILCAPTKNHACVFLKYASKYMLSWLFYVLLLLLLLLVTLFRRKMRTIFFLGEIFFFFFFLGGEGLSSQNVSAPPT